MKTTAVGMISQQRLIEKKIFTVIGDIGLALNAGYYFVLSGTDRIIARHAGHRYCYCYR